MICIDYVKANECRHSETYMCRKCSDCGRIFDKGFMVDDKVRTIAKDIVAGLIITIGLEGPFWLYFLGII